MKNLSNSDLERLSNLHNQSASSTKSGLSRVDEALFYIQAGRWFETDYGCIRPPHENENGPWLLVATVSILWAISNGIQWQTFDWLCDLLAKHDEAVKHVRLALVENYLENRGIKWDETDEDMKVKLVRQAARDTFLGSRQTIEDATTRVKWCVDVLDQQPGQDGTPMVG